MHFDAFKAGDPAQDMFRKLGFEEFLSAASSWRTLRALIVDYNDKQKRGAFVDAARRCDGVASSGERILLHAILFATDFAWLADELANGQVWQRMDRVSGPHLNAVAACILMAEARDHREPAVVTALRDIHGGFDDLLALVATYRQAHDGAPKRDTRPLVGRLLEMREELLGIITDAERQQ